MTPESRSVIHTAFHYHKTDESADELIDSDEFFTPDEFENTDHRVRGKFDEYGQFKGEISIYEETVPNHVINWRSGRGRTNSLRSILNRFCAF